MSARCEPPEEFRWKEGRHWLRLGTHDDLDTVAFWGQQHWTWGGRQRDPEDVHKSGWRYLAPVATPAEVEKLRAEVRRLREALEAADNGLDEVAERTWDKRRPDECRRTCDEASELAAGYRDEARAASHTRSRAMKVEVSGELLRTTMRAWVNSDGDLRAAFAAVIPAIRADELERAAVALNEMADFEADGRAVIALRGAAVVLRALKEGT
jgi:hypothetical protein